MAMRAATHRAGSSRARMSARCLVPVVTRPVTGRCVRGACRPLWEKWSCCAPGICVRTAVTGSVLPMQLWISGKRICRQVSGACWRWLARKRRSTTDGRRSNCWPALDVTAKAVERTAEAIGADIAAGEQREIHCALQLSLPIAAGQPIPIPYHWFPLQTVRHVLDSSRGKRHTRAPLLPLQPSV